MSRTITTRVPRWISLAALLALATATAANAQVSLSKVFTPSTIGPGSVSTITLTITNGGDGISYDHANWANAQVSCS